MLKCSSSWGNNKALHHRQYVMSSGYSPLIKPPFSSPLALCDHLYGFSIQPNSQFSRHVCGYRETVAPECSLWLAVLTFKMSENGQTWPLLSRITGAHLILRCNMQGSFGFIHCGEGFQAQHEPEGLQLWGKTCILRFSSVRMNEVMKIWLSNFPQKMDEMEPTDHQKLKCCNAESSLMDQQATIRAPWDQVLSACDKVSLVQLGLCN